jgi:hypothetical protein
MTLHRRPRIVIGLMLIALTLGTAAYRTTTATRIISAPPPQPETPATDFGAVFGTKVQEKLVKVDIRVPAVLGIAGVAMSAAAFIHRKS